MDFQLKAQMHALSWTIHGLSKLLKYVFKVASLHDLEATLLAKEVMLWGIHRNTRRASKKIIVMDTPKRRNDKYHFRLASYSAGSLTHVGEERRGDPGTHCLRVSKIMDK